MLLSVIFPARKRFHWLAASIDSLLSLARGPVEDLEILVGMDDDDGATQEQLRAWCADSRPQVCIYEFPRYGYKELHIYLNGLAGLARGQYLITWNDDALMLTEGWDEKLRAAIQTQAVPLVYQFQTAGYRDIFTAVPRAWYEILGHVSLCLAYDSWINDLADRLGVSRQIEIHTRHEKNEKIMINDYEIPQEDYDFGQQQLYANGARARRTAEIAHLRCVLYADYEGGE